jgi:hypothetical protein
MAKGDKDEHKMLFDIRGKRRNVVKVVYGVLALLMGLSLLLVAGPLPFGDIFGAQDATEEAREQFEDQAKRIEVKLAKDPQNPDLLLSLTRAHVSAGSSLAETNPETGEVALTVDARDEYEQASSVWSEYLKATDEPTLGAAQLMANTLFSLAQTSRSSAEAESNIKAAAEAQKIVADQRPSINSLSTFGLYTLYTFDYAGAKQANEEAKKFATSKFQREQLDKQYEEIRKQAKGFEKQLQEEEQLQKAAQEGQGGGQSGGGQPLQNPFGSGLGGTTLSE